MNHLTFEQAEIDSQKCDYAIDAAGTKENPINWGDAAGFYLSGYNAAVDQYLASNPSEKEAENLKMYENMQYYMEYCEQIGYVTPQDWIEKHKHF